MTLHLWLRPHRYLTYEKQTALKDWQDFQGPAWGCATATVDRELSYMGTVPSTLYLLGQVTWCHKTLGTNHPKIRRIKTVVIYSH